MFEEFELDDDKDVAAVPVKAGTALRAPEASQFCLGHGDTEKLLLSLYNSGKFPHSIALSGIKGIGKATLAYRFAKFLLQEQDHQADALFGGEALAATSFDIPENSDVFQKVASGGHPDLLKVERAYDEVKDIRKASLLVEDIRKIPQFMQSTAAMGGWRICVIDDADTMNISAQNALLKILEEPPQKSLLILVAHRMGNFLPTIKSRLRVFQCNPLNESDFNTLLDKSEINSSDKNLIYILSQGSFGVARSLFEEGGLEVIDDLLDGVNEQGLPDHLKIMTLADQLSGKGQDPSFSVFVLFMQKLSEEFVRLKALKRSLDQSELLCALPNKMKFQAFNEIFSRQSLQDLVEIQDSLRQHFRDSERAYLDKRFIVQHAFEILTGQYDHDG